MSVIAEINQLVHEYQRVLNEGDVDGIQALFLDACVLTQVDGGHKVAHMTLAQYCEVVRDRQAPKDAGHLPYGKVVMIDVAGPAMALVRLESAVQPRYFMDYLTLVKVEGKWRIASKVYYVMRVEQ